MNQDNVELIFQWFDQAASKIEQAHNMTYLDSLIEAGNWLFYKDEQGELSDTLSDLENINMDGFKKEEVRKGLQLAILKGMKGATQQHHYITPDSVAIFIGYLVQKFYHHSKEVTIFDPACGTANLLSAVMNQLSQNVTAFGSEVDSTLIQLAYINANLQKNAIELFHQDSLRPLLMKPADLVVSDLPVGYYPDDENAKSFELKAEEGHSYAHHLFIEQSLKYTKEGGYLFFLIPNFLFESDQADRLHDFLHKQAHIIGLLQLPLSMFKSDKNAKSIFIIQKKGKQTTPPKKALLADLPSFKDVHAMNHMLKQIQEWFDKEYH